MRILGFSKKWDKLNQPEFTTFRLPRKDRDWQMGEYVQVVYKPRSKNREPLGIAKITFREERYVEAYSNLSNEEARIDGFLCRDDMLRWLQKTHKGRHTYEPMNKLTLRWIKKGENNGRD